MLKEFKEFALKGNLVDLAVAFIIGAAFSGLVQSVVNDIIMPIVGLVTGGVDFSEMYIQMSGDPQPTLALAREAGATLAYGNFITLVINFLIVAWVLFLVVKAMNRLKKKEEEAPPPAPPREEVLLEEIRDLLAKKP
ncbi:MAG: large conductance mechanosensitive channel protein MscL [Bauldia sp.]|uniref:large conductance mechanosensitive channel protein MscL n=1 Tax=Bauldia sp. TaxID=2575872 RepID=UPI001D4FA831|nr:large conductance mechanosensitive channel protein MscL [Bauldia sp.]MCB1496684.1 large conductance mechanosensitive channel protein MscL [Bauldia sp.]